MQYFIPLIVAMGLLSFLLGGCNKQPVSNNSANNATPILKIAVFSDGRLTVDGTASTVQNLKMSLANLSDKQGEIWYYREASQQEPPPIAMDVMQAVIDAKLPIRFCSRPDYSDTIGSDDKPVAQPSGDHAVIVHFESNNKDLSDLFALENNLERAVNDAGVGEFDGNDVAVDGSDGSLYMYGPNADQLFAVVRPILEQSSAIRNAFATLRYGPPEDGIKSLKIRLQPSR